jgi:hypothetical protein
LPITDDAQILQVPLKAQGAAADDWAAVRANDLTQLNSVLRQMQEQFFKLNGRTGDAAIRSSLSVDGDVVSTGALAGASAVLGTVGLVPTDLSLAPDVEEALAPEDLMTSNEVGAVLPAGAASPFTAFVVDEFFGPPSATMVGDLSWTIVNGTVNALSETGHPGAVSHGTGVGPLVARITLNPLIAFDIGYLAAVVKAGPDIADVNYAFGVTSGNPNAGVEVVNGIYWSYVPGTSPNWRTLTRSGGVSTVNTTTVPVVASSWYLLEIVCDITSTAQTVDFYINRTRAFRHTTNVLTSNSVTPILIVQDTIGADKTLSIDKYIFGARAPLTVKRWS